MAGLVSSDREVAGDTLLVDPTRRRLVLLLPWLEDGVDDIIFSARYNNMLPPTFDQEIPF